MGKIAKIYLPKIFHGGESEIEENLNFIPKVPMLGCRKIGLWEKFKIFRSKKFFVWAFLKTRLFENLSTKIKKLKLVSLK